MKLNIYNHTEEVIEAIADFFIDCASKAIQERNIFNVSLSGGSSPKKLYQLLASDELKQKINWEKVNFFFGDERYVPHDHPESNFLMAHEALFAPLQISDEQVFKVNTDLDPATAALNYQRCICQHFSDKPIFDLVLLGLGDDAHTASLFPHTSLLLIDEEYVKEVYLQDKKVYRISMTAPLINNSRHVAFLTYGAGKANAIQAVLEEPKNILEYPAQLIVPINGQLHWFIDTEAASKLKKNSE